jgi:6-phosphofructokinase 1
MKKEKKIAVLTSGGDSPGMNAALFSIFHTSLKNNIKPYFIKDGFKGLSERNIEEAEKFICRSMIDKSGTIIGSARFPELADIENQKKLVKNLKDENIDNLIVIGGNGSYQGALSLSNYGINCVAVPGTIDNDVPGTKFSIGFNSSVNFIAEQIKQLRFTLKAHKRCLLVEVMGRNFGEIALFAGISSGADIIIASENKVDPVLLIEKIEKLYKSKKEKYLIVLISEKLYNVDQLSKDIEKATKIETRALVLGLLQRSAPVTVFDRLLAIKMGFKAVEAIVQEKTKVCVAWNNDTIVIKNIIDCFQEKLKIDQDYYSLINIFNQI